MFANIDDNSFCSQASVDKENEQMNIVGTIEQLLNNEKLIGLSAPSFCTPTISRCTSGVPTPKRVVEEDSGWDSKTSEQFILEQIKILSAEVVKIGDKIKENEC
jgi:hypothetical protein